MPALIPIRLGSSPEGTPLRPLVPGVVSGGSCVIGPISGTTPFDGLGATGLFSVSRKLDSSFVGDLYITDGLKRVDTLYDQSGNARDLNNVGGFSFTPSVVCFDSDPVNALQYTSGQILRSVAAFSDFVTATDGYIIATVKVTAVPVVDYMLITSNWPLNPAGFYVGASGPIIAAVTNNSEAANGSISVDTVYVFEWRHEGGLIHLRINGAGEINHSGGNINGIALSSPLNVGGQFLSNGLTGYIYEAGLFSAVPNLATRDALVQDMGNWVGAAV